MNVPNVTAVEDARAIYHAIPKDSKEEKVKARKAWSDLCIAEVEKVVTVEDAIAIFKAAPWGTPAKLRSLEKWTELCTTFEELETAYKTSLRRFKWDNPALEKWNAISCVEVHTAMTIEEVQLAFFSSPPAPYLDRNWCEDSRSRAFSKLLGFYNTLDELQQCEDLLKRRGVDLRHWDGLETLFHKKYCKVHEQERGYPFVPMSLL
jgi:hypothetical protein